MEWKTAGVRQFANFLKSVEDAQKIRSKIVDAFESANLPGQPEEERQRLLRFVVVGGGPTGVEYAAELHGTLLTHGHCYLRSRSI
jgi:NADH dehydrogenase FAD-containing subunit